MSGIREFLEVLFKTPSDQKYDPYGWLTNQISHTHLGHVITLILSIASFYFLFEYPPKWLSIWIIVWGYINFEIIFQGWKGWDTITDTSFVTMFGAVSVIMACSEKTPGDPILDFNPFYLIPWLIVFFITLMIGVWNRIEKSG